LMAANWPGNVRELEHTVQRTIVRWRGGQIYRFELNIESELVEESSNTKRARVSQVELVSMLSRHRGRLGPVAEAFGVSIRTIQRRLDEFGLNLKDFRSLRN